MRNYACLTPEGTSDVLFDEVDAYVFIEEKMRDFFKKRSFKEVHTPGLEYYDVFTATRKYLAAETMYKLSDHQGRLIVVRPDSTIPIARLVASKLASHSTPLRLYYNQSVFRVSRRFDGMSHEIRQMGVELIGAGGLKPDLEILLMACEVFDELSVEDYRLELGHVAIFKELMAALEASEEDKERIIRAIEEKNYADLEECLGRSTRQDVAAMLAQLPRLFGGQDVLIRAQEILGDFNPVVSQALDSLEKRYQFLVNMGYESHIMLDFGLINQADYYSGLIFRGYLGGTGRAVLSGGRYDQLLSDFGVEKEAIGFGMSVSLLAKHYLRHQKVDESPRSLLYADIEDWLQIKELRKGDDMITGMSLTDSLEAALDEAAQGGYSALYAMQNGKLERYEVERA